MESKYTVNSFFNELEKIAADARMVEKLSPWSQFKGLLTQLIGGARETSKVNKGVLKDYKAAVKAGYKSSAPTYNDELNEVYNLLKNGKDASHYHSSVVDAANRRIKTEKLDSNWFSKNNYKNTKRLAVAGGLGAGALYLKGKYSETQPSNPNPTAYVV